MLNNALPLRNLLGFFIHVCVKQIIHISIYNNFFEQLACHPSQQQNTDSSSKI